MKWEDFEDDDKDRVLVVFAICCAVVVLFRIAACAQAGGLP